MKLRFVVFVELLVVMKVLKMPRKAKAALDKGQRSSDGRKQQHLSKQHNDTRWRCAHRTKVSPCSSCDSSCFLVCVLSISFFLRSFSGSPDFGCLKCIAMHDRSHLDAIFMQFKFEGWCESEMKRKPRNYEKLLRQDFCFLLALFWESARFECLASS